MAIFAQVRFVPSKPRVPLPLILPVIIRLSAMLTVPLYTTTKSVVRTKKTNKRKEKKILLAARRDS
jgi:hypothetical protein